MIEEGEMDITDELEARASTVYGGAFAAMMTARKEILRLRNQVATGKAIVAAGVELMTKEQVSEWNGVRSFLEQDTSDYSTQPHNV
jgi:hypothetical protein